jgi:hypothetical protein
MGPRRGVALMGSPVANALREAGNQFAHAIRLGKFPGWHVLGEVAPTGMHDRGQCEGRCKVKGVRLFRFSRWVPDSPPSPGSPMRRTRGGLLVGGYHVTGHSESTGWLCALCAGTRIILDARRQGYQFKVPERQPKVDPIRDLGKPPLPVPKLDAGVIAAELERAGGDRPVMLVVDQSDIGSRVARRNMVDIMRKIGQVVAVVPQKEEPEDGETPQG